jgi:N6-adenosine-specific RNA methylase IME4
MSNEANITYGETKEALFNAGYSLERALQRIEGLLTGDDWRACANGFDNVNDFIRSLRLDKFQVLAEDRTRIARRIKELQPAASNRAIADSFGVGRSTINRDVDPNGPPNRKNFNETKDAPPIRDPNGPPDEETEIAEAPARQELTGAQAAALVERAEHKAEAVEEKKARRAEREEELAEKTAAISESIGYQLYNVILADPAWQFEVYSENGMDRSADNHYPTSAVEEFMALKVPDATAEDCVLYLWVTVPMLLDGLALMGAWGFEYKSHIVWIKDKVGTGYWSRNRHELLLIGTKGKPPAPAMGTQSPSAIEAPVGRHSEKPVIFYEIIEAAFPTVPKLEMFARTERSGWDSWGNEVE